MKAMILSKTVPLNEVKEPLQLINLPAPKPEPGEILIKVTACGICHTELDEIEGRTPPPRFPVIPGHQIVGLVVEKGVNATRFTIGDRAGIGWIHSTCGSCEYCASGQENLCPSFTGTGRDVHGGYAEYTTVPEDFACLIPANFSDAEAAPLLCAGGVGYRSLKLSGLRDGQNLGLTGFGASGHLVLKLVQQKYPRVKTYVFTRGEEQRKFALEIGAYWAGPIEAESPVKLHAIIDTTPAWKPVVEALKNLASGGRLVINAIRKEDSDKKDLLNLDYQKHLWLEKEVKSVANVTRGDLEEFLNIASAINLKPEFQTCHLEEANEALQSIKRGNVRGAKVIVFP